MVACSIVKMTFSYKTTIISNSTWEMQFPQGKKQRDSHRKMKFFAKIIIFTFLPHLSRANHQQFVYNGYYVAIFLAMPS